MNYSTQDQQLKQLQLENFLSLLFVAAAVINIYGDKIQQAFVVYKNPNDEKKSRDIFLIALLITFVVYIYFLNRNQKSLKKAIMDCSPDVFAYQVRLFGTVLLIVGILCFIYFNRKVSNIASVPPL